MLKGKKILIGITGSIAAYKIVTLVRLLIKADAEVRVITTPAAKDFVSTLTLSTLSKSPVLTDLFNEESWSNHVLLGRWADLMIIAPLSCNTLAKMAYGHCDNLLLATYLSANVPVIVAPAMDEDMWHHPSTAENLKKLESFRNKIIPVENGELASGLFGEGRMAEPEKILEYINNHFSASQALAGKKALVTAGPTYEAIDPVRFVGNHSSGKMGIAIAKELHRKGAEVTLVLGPSGNDITVDGIKTIRVVSAKQMFEACAENFSTADISVMAAAVADYTPVATEAQKIKKKEGTLTIELTKTVDILKTLGNQKREGQIVIGFALETTNEAEYAKEKLKTKNADMIVLNSLNDAGAGFGLDTNKVTLFTKDEEAIKFDTKSKGEVARDIVETIIRKFYA